MVDNEYSFSETSSHKFKRVTCLCKVSLKYTRNIDIFKNIIVSMFDLSDYVFDELVENGENNFRQEESMTPLLCVVRIIVVPKSFIFFKI